MVISTSIDKYCYILAKHLPPFLDYNYRIIYSQQELVKEIDEIKHPAARECLKFMKVKKPTEIVHSGDLPARAGLGSSSAFTVGLLNTLYALDGKRISKENLAEQAIKIEQDWIKEAVGNQDQVATAVGGFNIISFKTTTKNKDIFKVEPIFNKSFLEEFNKHLLLFFTGYTRNAFEIERAKIEQIHNKAEYYNKLQEITNFASECFMAQNLNKIGKLLHETWMIKRELCNVVTTPVIDEIYNSAIESGAIGGKLIGSGGGGFMIFFVPIKKKEKVKETLKNLMEVPFKFENSGSEIIYYNGEV